MLAQQRKGEKIQRIREIEYHLKHYQTYKIGIKNLKKQLDYILPNVTANYELREGSSGTFNISSSTENCALDRIEGKRALILHEQIKDYELKVEAIDEALKDLQEHERQFIDYRYYRLWSFTKIAAEMGYSSETSIFSIRNQAFSRLLISLRGIVTI